MLRDLASFEPLCRSIASEFFLPGGDQDDLLQEARIGAWKGLRDWRPDGGATLSGFVAMCIRRQCITAVKLARAGKHRVLDEALRADARVYGEDESLALVDTLVAPGADPACIVEDRERVAAIIDAIATTLSPLERRALIGFVNGLSYAEIAASTTDVPRRSSWRAARAEKTIDNALFRARRKLSDPPTEAALAA